MLIEIDLDYQALRIARKGKSAKSRADQDYQGKK